MNVSAVPSSSRPERASVLVAQYLPLHAAVFGTLVAIDHPHVSTVAGAVFLWVLGVFAIHHRSARTASFLLCVAVSTLVFPLVPNHGYVFCVALLVGAIFDVDTQVERVATEDGFRRLAAIVWFWSGMQKVLSGTWSHGQFLAYEVGHSARFGKIFGALVSSAEQRIFRLDGPFMGNAALSNLSNLVWILEIGVGLALLFRTRFRHRAAIVGIGLLVAVEVVARESIFGILMVALLVAQLDVRFRARWLWLLVPIEVLAIGGRLSFVPGGFH